MKSFNPSLVICAIMACPALLGQGVQPGAVEAAGFAGVASVIDGGGNHVAGGGSVGVAATRRVLVVGEVSYVRFGLGTFEVADVSAKASAGMTDFNGGLHFSLSEGKTRPYLAFGVGAGRGSASVRVNAPGVGNVSASGSDTEIGFNAGGGVRLYLGDNWGIRPEFKVFRYSIGDESATLLRFAIGIFIHTRKS